MIPDPPDAVPDSEIYNNLDSAVDTRRVPFFALIIGIDDYEKVSKLSGATADADDMDQLLRNHLNIPTSHIINLRNKTATREGILQAFHNLQINPEINRDDALFIYFAGHGSEMEAPAGWSAAGSKIQVLLPQDVNMPDPSQSPIPPIPDRTLAILLNNLAEAKGNNITVVLDCCHSSSGTRGVENDRVARRVAKLPHKLPKNLDNGFLPKERARNMNTPPAFRERNLRSHVLLAACGSEELAYENTRLGRGAFTTAFVQTLIATGVDKLTYLGFMDRLPNLPRQNPQCEGYYSHRMLFNAKLPGADHRFIGIQQKDNTYKLKAGNAQGVTVNSEFTIHADHTHVSKVNPPLCRMRAKEVNPFSTTLEPIDDLTPVTIPKPAYAREVLCGSGQELRVHFSEALERIVGVKKIHQASASSNESNFGFIVSDAASAEMLLDIKDASDDKCVVTFTTGLATQYGYKMLPHSVKADAESISRVLRAVARWFHHFKRTNHRFSESVEIEFYRLDHVDGQFDDDGMKILSPTSPDKNMNGAGVVDIVVQEDHFYGVKIVNNSKIDLYPYLFYFDLSDQSIDSYYLPQKGRNRVDSPLRAGCSHTVGYGAGGEVPFAYHLRSGEDIDVGFLKLFVSTSPTDFYSLKQSTPFQMARGTVSQTDTIQKLKQGPEQWGTIMAVIVQRSHHSLRSTKAPLEAPSEASPIPSNASSTPSAAPSIPLKASSASLTSPQIPLTNVLNTCSTPPQSTGSPTPAKGWLSSILDCFKCFS